jgi:serine/threonine protein kinase
MTTRQNVSPQRFLAKVRESGLLTAAQLAEVAPQLPRTQHGRVVARALVDHGLLTKFQAERILIGRTAGFQLGQYRILDQLGQGGMGRVFKAQHRTMKRTVALKVLAPTLVQSDRAQELFLHEVRAAAQLNHPNIVAAYDANEGGGRYYLVMEYVDGPNFEQLVQSNGPLPLSQACDFIRQTALGLQCAHERGMVHRDIKPANLLVQRGGNDGKSADVVKISDFGLARLQAPDAEARADKPAATILTKENTVMGTPDYLSPEQARNLHKADIRSDLYSLGCTFYFLLTGQVPFPGGKAVEKLIRHGVEQPTPIHELRPQIPAAVVAIIERLMAKQPNNRYQTPAELVEALAPFAASSATPCAPVEVAHPSALLDESDESKGYNSNPEVVAVASNDLSALANTVSNSRSPTRQDTAPRRKLPAPATQEMAVSQPSVNGFKYWPLLAVLGTLCLLGGMSLAGALLLLVPFRQ